MRSPSAALAVVAGLVATLATPLAAAAVPAPMAESGSPRTASAADPTVLFVEDFENGVTTTPVLLDAYTGANGETYTADPAWIDAAECNGIVTSRSSSDMAGCSANRSLKALGSVLGQITGENETTNHVVSAWTSSKHLPKNAVQIESRDEFSLGQTGRFVSFGVSAAAGACVGYTHPLLDFMLVDGGVERPVSERPLDPCDDPRSTSYTVDGSVYRGGEFVSSGGVLFSGDSLRWRLRNAQTDNSGNDGAIDRVTIVDSTPTLANEFSGEPIIGDTARMAVRVVNTSEHGAKPGWSFTQALPEGLSVAPESKVTTTCAAADLDVEGGATRVGASGDLDIDTPDCTVSFDVSASAPGTYTIGTDAVTEHVGLDLPAAPASITFAPESNELRATDQAVLAGGNDDGVADLGETVAFRTTVENAGNVLLREVAVSSPNGAVDCPVQELAPDASTSCTTRPREVTQDDLDHGSIDDSASVAARSRAGQPVTASTTATVPTTSTASAAELAVTPVVRGGAPGVGDGIGLAATVTNVGNVSIRDLAVTVSDEPDMKVTCPPTRLAPGASVDCAVAGTHRVSQQDVDRGTVAFVAALTAVDAAGQPVRDDARTAQATVTQAPALATTVTPTLVTAGEVPTPGDEVSLSIAVRNVGNVTLRDVVAEVEDREGLRVSCPDGPVAPRASIDCTVPAHALSQGDIDAGTVEFAVSATATAPGDRPVGASDSASVAVDRRHGIVATATAVLADGSRAPEAGDRVQLSVSARNSGNTTLRGLAAEVDDRDLDVECAEGALAPGASADCSIEEHVVTQTEIDAGTVDFALTVTADGPGGQRARASDTVSVELASAPAIAMSATSVLDANEHEVPLAGDTATVSMTIRNTGNVTVTGIRGEVEDRTGLEVGCPSDELAPGASVTCEVSRYALAQSDVDAGAVRFMVSSAATGADRQRVEARADTTLSIVRSPSITSSATAAVDDTEHGAPRAGDTASVHMSITNTGNVAVHALRGLVDERSGMAVTCPDERLAPGASADCAAAEYSLTQADIDAGEVQFDLIASAVGPDDRTVTADADAGTAIERAPAVQVQVTAYLADAEHGASRAGDRVTMGIRATNTGNVTLTDTRAEVVELADVPVACDAEGVAPGASVDCTTPEYVLTQADVDRGTVTVAVVLDATGPADDSVTARDEVHVGLTAASALDLSAEPVLHGTDGSTEAVAGDRVLRPGDRVSVRYEVRNTGNLTVHDLQQAEGMPAMTCDHPTLEPGQRAACEGDVHVVTEEEATTGEVVITGQAAGQVMRADGATTEEPGAASTGQTATAATFGATPAASSTEPVWVFSLEVRTELHAEPQPAPDADRPATAPVELAFTGSTVLAVGVPAAVLLLLVGAVLLLWRRRRNADDRQV